MLFPFLALRSGAIQPPIKSHTDGREVGINLHRRALEVAAKLSDRDLFTYRWRHCIGQVRKVRIGDLFRTLQNISFEDIVMIEVPLKAEQKSYTIIELTMEGHSNYTNIIPLYRLSSYMKRSLETGGI